MTAASDRRSNYRRGMPPLVHLIGGPPGGGKTTLAWAVAGALGVPSLTIDDIRTSLLGVTTPDSHPDLHVIGLPDPWSYFTQTDPPTQLEHAIAQQQAMWPAIEKLIRKRLATDAPIVIDGWHLMPDLLHESDLGDVECVFLDVDRDVLIDREMGVWDFYAASDRPDVMFANFVGRSLLWNEEIARTARSHGYRVLHQDGSKSVAVLADEALSR